MSIASLWSLGSSLFIADALRADVIMAVSFLVLVLSVYLAQPSTAQEVVFNCDHGRFPPEETDRPVIGILSMELSPTIRKFCSDHACGDHDSYVAASYVKFVEGAGARVAPILIGQSDEYYREMAGRVNGLLFPGGATYFTDRNGYGDAGKRLYAAAEALNEGGVHLPVLGICLGMQLMMEAAAGEDIRRPCRSEDPLPLEFLPGSKRNSRLFSPAQSSVIHTLEKENVTANHHKRCITRQDMESRGLTGDWHPLTVNKDATGMEFVSVFEHRRLPFYGVQFHPEKNAYEWKRSKNYPHWPQAIAASRYFADFLVAEARRNRNSFPEEEERDHLIYRHQPVDTRNHLMWEQLYFFPNSMTGDGTTLTSAAAPAAAPPMIRHLWTDYTKWMDDWMDE